MDDSYLLGRAAFFEGKPLHACPYSHGREHRNWANGWQGASEDSARLGKENEADRRIQNAADAIEALIDAKLSRNSAGPNKLDVNETREHLRDKLAELLCNIS